MSCGMVYGILYKHFFSMEEFFIKENIQKETYKISMNIRLNIVKGIQ